MRPNPIGQVPRLVVVQPAGGAGRPGRRLPVGVTTHMADEPRLTIIVKATFDFRGGRGDRSRPIRARLAARQLPLSLDEPSLALDAGPEELHYASDFAPRKERADVLLVGHAQTEKPAERIEGRFAFGELERRFLAVSPEPAPAIALSQASLRPVDDETPVPLGPVRPEGHDDVFHGRSFDYRCYNAAAAPQQTGEIDLGGTIELEGLCPGDGRRQIELPGLTAQATVEDPWRGVRDVALRADTLWIDADREQLVILWRGDVEVIENGREVERIVLWLDRCDRPRSREQILPLLQRGRVAYVVRPVDREPGAEPIPTDDETLRIHRLKTWRSPPPEPELTVEQYATISAELAECSDTDQRATVLERHDYDEERWTIEERGWLDRMSQEALQGSGTTAALYGVHFVAAQDALGSDEEMARSFDEFLEISEAMASTAEPAEVLAAHRLTLPMWMRLDRRFQRRMKRDADLAARYRARLGKLGAAPPELPEELG